MPVDTTKGSLLRKFRIDSPNEAIKTILFSMIAAGIFVLAYLIPMPFVMVSLFAFGLVPALAIIAVTGAIRGPIAGLLTGYLGILIHDLFFGTVVTFTLPALAYGLLGLIAGLPTYDFSKGRSLGKLSIIAAVGFVFTVLLVVVVGLYVEDYSTLAAIGFVLLRLLTLGLPSVILLTPIFARAWLIVSTRLSRTIQPNSST
jgi:uncharacterized membrane protein